jgi:predicted nucleic acid-binding protein
VPVTVSNTSPIRALAHLELLHLLELLFGEVLIPEAVADELLRPAPLFEPVLITRFPFLRVRAVERARAQALGSLLDAGESEAIALAEEVGAGELLIDEAGGRSEAARRGLKVVGVLGILLRAKVAGMIPAVGPLIERLRDELHFFVSDVLRDEVLRRANEHRLGGTR